MLIQIYRRTFPGIELVNEYYQWPAPLTEQELRDDTRSRAGLWIECPGCGERRNRYRLHEHRCSGSRTAHPVEPERVHTQNHRQVREQRLRDYLEQNPRARVGSGLAAARPRKDRPCLDI